MKEEKNILTETHIITNSNEHFKALDDMCFKAKNLYNFALYNINRIMNPKEPTDLNLLYSYNFLDSKAYYRVRNMTYKGTYPNYNFMDKYLKTEGLNFDYKALPSVVAQQTLKKLDKNWTSYFKAVVDYSNNPSKYKAIPKKPKYLEKDGRFVAIFPAQQILKTNTFKKNKIKLSQLDILIPFINNRKTTTLLEVRIVPINDLSLKIEIVYDCKDIKKYQPIKGMYAGIDLGLKNNATLTYLNINTPIFIQPLIVRSSLTSINQFYNKQLAKYQSELPKGVFSSKKIQLLTFNRNNKIKNEMHNISFLIVKELVKNKVDTLCIGYTEGWKQKSNIGKKNNQKFVQIPFHNLISQLQYKCERYGIKVILTEESYTSKSSFLDLDPLPKYDSENKNTHLFSGKRVKRGLYVTSKNIKINADVNGSYNQIRKATPTVINQRMLEGVLVSPILLRIGKIEPVTQVRVISNRKCLSKNKGSELICNELDVGIL